MTDRTEPTKPEIPASRRIVYMLIIVSIPLIILISIELALRIIGYGEDPDFFATQTVGGTEYYKLNPDIARRYFPRLEVTPAASDDVFPSTKGPGVKRVFFLGASTMLGYPAMYNAAVSSVIRDALRKDYPEASVEIVNLSMTAVTSQFVREVGTASLDHDPDVIVIYAGHNEYYGGLGVASTETLGPRWLTRLYLDLRNYRVVQGLASVLSGLASAVPSDQEVSGTLMEALAREQEIPYGSDLYAAGLEAFRANITELIEDARSRGVQVIVSTLVSNIRDLPPFRPLHGSDVPEENRQRSRELLNEYEALRSVSDTAGRYALGEALRLDPDHALTLFLAGRFELQDGNDSVAYAFLSRARDRDGLRFRASAELNGVIRDLAAHSGVTVVDVEELIRPFSHHRIPGNDLLYEHVHPTIRGYEVMASILYPAVQRSLGLQAQSAGPIERPLRSSTTSIDSVAAAMRLDILMNSWPFTTTRKTLADITPADWREELAYAYLSGSSTWEQMHVGCAERYERDGRYLSAIQEYEALKAATPYNVSPYLRAASLHIRIGSRSSAVDLLRRSLEVEQTSQGHLMLGQISYDEGRYDDAVTDLRKALALGQVSDQKILDIRLSIAVALQRAGRTGEALDEVRRLRTYAPAFTPAQEFEAYLTR